MKQSKFPQGWDEERVRRVLADYEQQTEEEASFDDTTQTVMEVSKELVPAIRELIAKRRARSGRPSRSRRRPRADRA